MARAWVFALESPRNEITSNSARMPEVRTSVESIFSAHPKVARASKRRVFFVTFVLTGSPAGACQARAGSMGMLDSYSLPVDLALDFLPRLLGTAICAAMWVRCRCGWHAPAATAG